MISARPVASAEPNSMLNPGTLMPTKIGGRHSPIVRKQLDRVAKASHRIFADAFEVEIALDLVGERAGQQHLSVQLFGQGFQTRSHVDGRTDDSEVEPGERADVAVHD